jgi:PAS domain S-box-containing protein
MSTVAPTLTAFIRAHKPEILAEWEIVAQRVSAAAKLDRPTLIDHIPALLDQIANHAEQLAAGVPVTEAIEIAQIHALERSNEGYDLTEVIAEYSVLRDCILRMWFEAAAIADATGPRALHEAIDAAMGEAVRRFTQARDRTLAALDKIASAALETRSLDELLERLLRVFLETTAAVDSAAILLLEGDVLRVRATVGVESGLNDSWTSQIGQGFAGMIAQSRQPLALENAAEDPRALSPSLRAKGIKGLFGVPLIEGGELIGVAHMGSLTAPQFSKQDERLFLAMANRATSAIQLHLLREREQAVMQELQERELQFRSIADNMPQLAWIADATGAIRWYNQRWYDYTGTTWEQTGDWGWRAVHHPDHVERTTEKFTRHIGSGEPWEDTFPLRGADGRFRWFLSRAAPIRDATGRVVQWFGTNTDVSEQRLKHETAIMLSSSLDYRETLARVAHVTVASLADWCAIDVLEGTQLERVAVAHADPAKADLSLSLPIDASVRNGRTACGELGIASYVIAPLVVRDSAIGAITVVSADPRRRYAPADVEVIEQLGRRIALAVDNARLYEAAQREGRMREEVLAVVSHDLKNPLGAIHLAAAMLLGNADAKSRSFLETIQRSASRMDTLIGDLLDVASIQAGRLAVEAAPVNAAAVLREAFESQQPMAREKGITLALEAQLPGVILDIDRDRVLQVFGNLLGNAIKFCGAGDTVTIAAQLRDHAVELQVRDTGPGIQPDELPRIFEPYWSAKRHARKGTGLGLYISKGIVEAHRGRLWAESTPGKGSTFYFTLPIAG